MSTGACAGRSRFSLAKEKGIITAMVVSKEKFQHLNLPNSVDRFIYSSADSSSLSIAHEFVSMVGKLKPGQCFIHFGESDVKGHAFGIHSVEKMQAFKDSDPLKMIRDAVEAAGLASTSVFILTADHGCHHTIDKNGMTRGSAWHILARRCVHPLGCLGKRSQTRLHHHQSGSAI